MKRALAVLLVSLVISSLLALAGSHNGVTTGAIAATNTGGYPVFALCIALAFAAQWLAFIPALIFKTEKFYDLTGSATYLSVVALACYYAQDLSLLKMLIAVCVSLWAMRLGGFLFLRILHDKKDRRFDEIKSSPARFFATWTLQGLWVSFTAAAALAAITSLKSNGGGADIGIVAIAGALLWLLGFSIEALADAQKRRFKQALNAEGNRDAPSDVEQKQFIDSGLWSISRHPNYVGEIVLWAGIALMALPLLSGWQYATLISPVFVYLLLTRISGIPLLERAADKRFANDAAYQRYKQQTPVLFPRL